MTVQIVDTRFAGGHTTVEPAVIGDDVSDGVALHFPGYEVALFNHEALRLGVALIAAAHESGRPKADDWP